MLFFGTFVHSLDHKGRLVVPVKFRGAIGERLYAMRGYESCLSIYHHEHFQQLVKTLDTLDYNNKTTRDFIRLSLSSVIELDIDDHGRILIPAKTMADYGFSKEVMLIGSGDHFEVWEKDKWIKYEQEQGAKYEQIGEHLLKK